MNTKAAIKKLPTLDKRWSLHCGIASFNYGKPGQWDIDADNCTDPMSLVAAAKTLGYEIWWTYDGEGYWPMMCATGEDDGWYDSTICKSPAAAIVAAFCAVVKAKGE